MGVKIKALVAALAAAFLFGAGWVANGWRLGGQLSELEKQHAISLAIASNHANERYQKMERGKDEAIKAHAALAAENAAAADLAARTADRLRRGLSGVPARIAAATREAVDEYAATVSEVLGACTAEYQWMAEQADGHAADVGLMQDAWPK